MKYDIGVCLADYGFSFLEKVHEPIFLVSGTGSLVKINEAGRKFLHVAHLTNCELEGFFTSAIASLFKSIGRGYRRISIGKGCQLIARRLPGSGMTLVEIVRKRE
jgi:hypothetical protein